MVNRKYKQGDYIIVLDRGVAGYITHVYDPECSLLSFEYIVDERLLTYEEHLIPYSEAAAILYGHKIKKGASPNCGGVAEGTSPKTLHPSKV